MLNRKMTLSILILATLLDLFIPIVLGFYYDNYSHWRDTISALGVKGSPVAHFESLNLVVVGILLVVFSFGQKAQLQINNRYTRRYLLGIFLFGMGTIVAGIFPEDAIEQESISGKIHGISSAIGFIFLIVNPLWAAKIHRLKCYKLINFMLFIFAVVTFVLFIVSENITTGLLQYTGLFQRINLLILYGMLILNFITIDKRSPYEKRTT
jgi:hypothetical membrane protein